MAMHALILSILSMIFLMGCSLQQQDNKPLFWGVCATSLTSIALLILIDRGVI